ncbi:MAG: hypothetical protein ACE5D7_03165 [Fidelibacterota bacterium]
MIINVILHTLDLRDLSGDESLRIPVTTIIPHPYWEVEYYGENNDLVFDVNDIALIITQYWDKLPIDCMINSNYNCQKMEGHFE